MTHLKLSLFTILASASAFSVQSPTHPRSPSSALGAMNNHHEVSRGNFLGQFTTAAAFVFLTPPQRSDAATSYSANARNMERINQGDNSGGSVYDNNPSGAGARRRRAMTGCKIPSARAEAASLLGSGSLEEKDCNIKVMDESPDFMLEAMKNLECPTCAYGVNTKR